MSLILDGYGKKQRILTDGLGVGRLVIKVVRFVSLFVLKRKKKSVFLR